MFNRRLSNSALLFLSLWFSAGTAGFCSEVTAAERELQNKAASVILKGLPSIPILLPIVKKHPDYAIARKNLSIAYMNAAIALQDKPTIVLEYCWKSLCLVADNPYGKGNLMAAVSNADEDPDVPETHLKLARQCMKRKCLYGAFIEYQEAIWMGAGASAKAEFADLLKTVQELKEPQGDDWFAWMALSRDEYYDGSKEVSANSIYMAKFEGFMAALQSQVKAIWKTGSVGSVPREAMLSFDVARTGLISNLKVSKSSGNAAYDTSCVRCMQELGRTLPLPAGSPAIVNIEFSFSPGSGSGIAEERQNREARLLAVRMRIQKLESEPSNRRYLPSPLLEEGELEKQLGRYQRGIESYSKAIEVLLAAPVTSRALLDAYYGKADCEHLAGDLKASAATLSQAESVASSMNNDDASIRSILELHGKVLFKDNQPAEAEKYYQRVRTVKR